MENAVIEFVNKKTDERIELEVPLNITANELISALNFKYKLGINREDYHNFYMCMENPIGFFRGERSLEQFGVRNGTVIIFNRK